MESAIYGLFVSGKYIPALIVVAYLGLKWASGKFPSLKSGRVAAIIASAIGAFATIAQAAASGTTPNLGAVVLAIAGAVGLYLGHPADAVAPAPAAK